MAKPGWLLLPLLLAACAADPAEEAGEPTPAQAGLCDPEALAAALAAASPGSEILAGDCRIVGALTVPSGVTLRGGGAAATTLVVPAGGVGVELAGGTLLELGIESGGAAAVLVRGGATGTLERIEIHATTGIGIGAEGLDALTLRDVTLTGPLASATDALALGAPPHDRASTATVGLLLLDVAAARLERVTTSGFASYGMLAVRSDVSWTGGGASGNLGVGLELFGGTATLEGLTVCSTWIGSGLFAAGLVSGSDAQVTTSGLTVCGSEAFGLVHDGGAIAHEALTVEECNDIGLWAVRSRTFSLSGGSSLRANRAAGLALWRPEQATVEDTSVSDTVLVRIAAGALGTTDVGDGVELIEPAGPATLRDLTLTANGRIGLVLDSPGASAVLVERVTVDATGAGLGALLQAGGGAEPLAGVTRTGSAGVNDPAITDPLALVGAIEPEFQPLPAELEAGLDGLF